MHVEHKVVVVNIVHLAIDFFVRCQVQQLCNVIWYHYLARKEVSWNEQDYQSYE